MKLIEILNSKPKYEIINDTQRWLTIKSQINNEYYEFNAEKYKDYWGISFISYQTGFALTKRGIEFKIFALAGELISLLIKKHNPDKIMFNADKKEGRVALYLKLAKRISGYTISDFSKTPRSEFEFESDDSETIFLVRNDLTESLNSEFEFKVDVDTPTEYQVSTKIDGKKIVVRMDKVKDIWRFAFSSGGSFHNTGKGSEFKIFGFTKQIFNLFVKKYSPDIIGVDTANERANLYVRLAKNANAFDVKIKDAEGLGEKYKKIIMTKKAKA